MSKIFAAVVLVVGCLFGSALAADLDSLEQRVREEINSVRIEHGLEPLAANATLGNIARSYSQRMQAQDFFAHVDPAGGDVADRLAAADLSYRRVGENIAYSYNLPNPVQAAVQGWLESPGHRANILNPHFSQTGVGIARKGEHYHFTQIFYTPPGHRKGPNQQ